MRLLRTQKSCPEKENMVKDAAEGVVQRIGCSSSELRRKCSPSPTPILVTEEQEYPAGILIA
jgi:hypothetical protein